MRVAVVLDGPTLSADDLDALRGAEVVVCADGATRHAAEAGRIPDLVVGDLDAVAPDILDWARAGGTVVQQHPAAKDATDGELAVDAACALGATHILLLGVTGGRLGMVLANLKLLARCRLRGVAAEARTAGQVVRMLAAGEAWPFGAAAAGGVLNVLAVGDDAVVSLHGTGWHGDHVVLESFAARGVSNPVASADARLTVRKGRVMAVLELPNTGAV